MNHRKDSSSTLDTTQGGSSKSTRKISLRFFFCHNLQFLETWTRKYQFTERKNANSPSVRQIGLIIKEKTCEICHNFVKRPARKATSPTIRKNNAFLSNCMFLCKLIKYQFCRNLDIFPRCRLEVCRAVWARLGERRSPVSSWLLILPFYFWQLCYFYRTFSTSFICSRGSTKKVNR